MFESKNKHDIQRPLRSRNELSWQRISFCFRCLMGNKQVLFFLLLLGLYYSDHFVYSEQVVFMYGPGLIMYEVQHQEDTDAFYGARGKQPCLLFEGYIHHMPRAVYHSHRICTVCPLFLCRSPFCDATNGLIYITVITSNQKKCMTYFANLVCFLKLHNIR